MAASAGAVILNFSAFSTVRNKYFLFKPLSLWCFHYNCPNWPRQKSNPTSFYSSSEYVYPLRVLRMLVRLEIKRSAKISSVGQGWYGACSLQIFHSVSLLTLWIFEFDFRKGLLILIRLNYSTQNNPLTNWFGTPIIIAKSHLPYKVTNPGMISHHIHKFYSRWSLGITKDQEHFPHLGIYLLWVDTSLSSRDR